MYNQEDRRNNLYIMAWIQTCVPIGQTQHKNLLNKLVINLLVQVDHVNHATYSSESI